MFRRVVPFEVVADEIIGRLLRPLKEFFPDVVQAVSQAFSDGRTPERAGQALQISLQARLEKERAERNAEKGSLNRTISELRDSVREKQTEIRNLKSQMEKLEKELEAVENKKEILEITISQQNKILAGQHEQLMRLLSSTQSDYQPY
jgi:peptidoglycan hydrolase CwlO-like protein